MIERANTGHLIYQGKFYSAESVYRYAARHLAKLGSKNIAFDMIPLFYTGSPYGHVILDMGCQSVEPPTEYSIEVVPHDSIKPWRSREPIWPQAFGVDPILYES
tara:strand:+ start:136 stop:447 length:312 start_codon:yes stop_codon:yes gene_type:complete